MSLICDTLDVIVHTQKISRSSSKPFLQNLNPKVEEKANNLPDIGPAISNEYLTCRYFLHDL